MGSYFRDFYSPKATERPTVGDTKFSVIGQDHMGWLKCDGRSLSTTNYNFLFQVIGYKFGGSGSTFNLPDAEGRVPGAVGQSVDDVGRTGAMRRLGDLSGEEVHLLSIKEMPAHKHGSVDVTGNTNGNGITDLSGAHTHSGTTDAAGYAASSHQVAVSATTTGTADDTSSHTHTFTTGQPSDLHHHKIGSTGGSAVHNNMQPTIFIGNMFVFSGKVRPSATNYYPFATGLTPPLI
jgi:microcystin-dependent protein